MKYTFRDLKNKVVVITGGNGFLGTQFTKTFLSVNSKVVVLDLKVPKRKIKNVYYISCDITNEEDVKNSLIKIKKKFQKLNILINNATNNYPPKKNNNKSFTFEHFDKSLWENDLKVGLTGSFYCTKIFGTHMSKNNGGKIINISSDLGIVSPDQRIYSNNFKKPITYSVVKHGIVGLTKYTATYWAKNNITCNALAPGGVYRNQPESFVKKVKKLIPLGRMAKKDEYNFLMLFLSSKHSSYLNGAVVVADGGRTIW